MYYVMEGKVIWSCHLTPEAAEAKRDRLQRQYDRPWSRRSFVVRELAGPGGYRGPDGNPRRWQVGDTPAPHYWRSADPKQAPGRSQMGQI